MRIGINGLGRIGRRLFRQALGLQKKDLNVVVVNTPSSVDMLAHLLKYDSVHGMWKVPLRLEDKSLWVGTHQVDCVFYPHPSGIPWDKWGVDWVWECSGCFKTREDLKGHFKKGVKKVFVAAPTRGEDLTLIYGVNHKNYNPEIHHLISNGSCTTNALAPLVGVMDKNFGLEEVMFCTVHAYTLDQKLLDSSHKKDKRRARASALSIVPTGTGAEETLTKIFPSLEGRLTGQALRVPVANVSLLDVVVRTKKPTQTSDLNQAFLAAGTGDLKGVLHCETQELVSVDFNGSPYSCVVDLASTKGQGRFFRVLAWYDNETGFSQRMLDFTRYAEKQVSGS